MASPALSPQDTCSVCGAPLSATKRHCPTCRADVGAPNVRRCCTNENLKALATRFDDARTRATTIGCSKEFCTLSDLMEKKFGVVVSMPAGVARKLFEDPNSLYANYEQLVGGNLRKSAGLNNDRHRCAVGGILFGSYANSIIYGALSLAENGLPTYGTVHCRLRSITIDKRTSFLETNSFKFIQDHGIVPGSKLPVGHIACWEHRHYLVLAKLADRLSAGQTESDWQAILIQSDGNDRKNDSFVEAHIFKSFDRNAIESLTATTGKKLRREEKLDLDIAISKFNSIKRKLR
ncbi:MAG: hypothetical protein KKI12_04365 [Proteobacteria bacterium]|nr:hypothetical protein [Pseudomonadota bacterium]MBU4287389.1 hypothetical protein [Pseudomonadota bacterium]MBU4414845.1 hypothetical protein [Pseudomonadota bacterium]MCG2759422.1 hypothetical protein [Desulfobacteraceae bacterium]